MGRTARSLNLHGGIPSGVAVNVESALGQIFTVAMTDSPDIGSAGTEGAVDFQVNDFRGNPVAEKVIIGLQARDPDAGDTTKPGALAANAVIGGATVGIELAGDDSNDLVVETNATGQFTAVLTDASDEDVFVVVHPVGGSPIIDCREFDSVEFTA